MGQVTSIFAWCNIHCVVALPEPDPAVVRPVH
jgi:hypothetical protein